MKQLTLLLIIVLLSPSLYANKLARVSIDDLLKEADQAALVSVIKAEAADENCGIIYTAKVMEPIKNTEKDTTITLSSRYSPSNGLRTGEMFIVFSNSTDSKTCTTAPQVLSHAGYGAFWVGQPYLIDYNSAVKIPKSFVKIPDSMNNENGKRSDAEISEVQWVDKNVLMPYLHSKHTLTQP